MIFQAVVGNPSHPEYGVATIPFPIPNDEYDHSIGLLEDLEVGDAVQTDLEVKEINGTWPVLKCLEDTVVNVDELDYLAKRLESFDFGEAAQFQAMADKLKLKSVPDLINLTFCCQRATVITDFSDLNTIGRDHYMNLHGGCASTQELEDLDGEETAILLIDGGGGTITRYGVVYDNGMKLEQHYDGTHFPGYFYEQNVLAVVIAPKSDAENSSNLTWIYLPCSKLQIEHALQRSGIADPEDMRFMYEDSALPSEVEAVLELRQESIFELNDLAHAIERLTPDGIAKLGAVVAMAQPEYAFQIRHLAENLDQFEFAPGVRTPAEYGKYIIQESGHFEYDPNLDEFYDYEKYGLQRMEQLSGQFVDRGYISYHGTMSLDELMMEDLPQMYFQMGGLS